jgi:hypothetical protein
MRPAGGIAGWSMRSALIRTNSSPSTLRPGTYSNPARPHRTGAIASSPLRSRAARRREDQSDSAASGGRTLEIGRFHKSGGDPGDRRLTAGFQRRRLLPAGITAISDPAVHAVHWGRRLSAAGVSFPNGQRPRPAMRCDRSDGLSGVSETLIRGDS